MTKHIKLAGYDPFDGDEPADVVIRISGIPPRHDIVEDLAAWYHDQAAALSRTLIDSLPQGVVHRLLIQLLERYASAYRGQTYGPTKGARND